MDKATDMTKYVVRILAEKGRGLGVETNGTVLTCAHFLGIFKVDRLLMQSVSVVAPADDVECGLWIQTVDSVLDFMVLGDQPVNYTIDDGDFGLRELAEPPIRPCRLLFAPGVDEAAVPGYCFAPDGKTPIPLDMRLNRDSHVIHIEDSRTASGCSGGPIFTDDHKLIGIIQGGVRFEDDSPEIGHGIRIDMAASGWLCQQLGGLDDLHIAG